MLIYIYSNEPFIESLQLKISSNRKKNATVYHPGFKVGEDTEESIQLSYLPFADDATPFLFAQKNFFGKLNGLLSFFEVISCLKINQDRVPSDL